MPNQQSDAHAQSDTLLDIHRFSESDRESKRLKHGFCDGNWHSVFHFNWNDDPQRHADCVSDSQCHPKRVCHAGT